jgi:hypothetical protein
MAKYKPVSRSSTGAGSKYFRRLRSLRRSVTLLTSLLKEFLITARDGWMPVDSGRACALSNNGNGDGDANVHGVDDDVVYDTTSSVMPKKGLHNTPAKDGGTPSLTELRRVL